jgi:hypothetical protein
MERVEALGPYKTETIELEGQGWQEAAHDIVLPGLGWVAITGCGPLKVTLKVPQDMEVTTRQSLLPFETQTTTAKFTGSKLNKKSGKGTQSVKSYGWRA